MQVEPPQHLLGAGQHALVFGFAVFRGRDGDEFDLGELVLPDHAARILAGGAGLGAEARRQRGEAQRQLGLVDDRTRGPDW